MKKSLLIVFLAFIGVSVNAQFSTNWEKTAVTDYAWFSAAGNTNGVAYNPITNKLYVTQRGTDVHIIDPATGAKTGTLDETGITPGWLGFNKIRVTATGEIYALALKTGGTGCSIIYWASESTPPVEVGGTIVLTDERAGDSFSLTGSGANVVLYIGGSGTSNLQVVNKNGSGDLVKVNNITLSTASAARTGIAPVTTGITSDIWISGSTIPKEKISSTGTVIKELADGLLVAGVYTALNSISNKFCFIEYFEIGTKRFLAATGSHDASLTGEGLAFHIYDVTDVDDVLLVEATKMTKTYTANTNPSGDISYKKTVNGDGTITMQFFQLINNNGLASHTLQFESDGTLPVTLTSFTASLTNNQNTLNWATSSESNSLGFEIESSTDGVTFSKIGFVASKNAGNSSATSTYSFRDLSATANTTYYRLKQVDYDGNFDYSAIKAISNPLNGGNKFSVYPNPAVDYVEISGDMTGVSLQLFTTSGVKINVNSIIEGNKLDVSGLNAGIYILSIVKDGQLIQTTKIIKK